MFFVDWFHVKIEHMIQYIFRILSSLNGSFESASTNGTSRLAQASSIKLTVRFNKIDKHKF